MTVLDLIKRSLRLLGVINTGSPTPTADEQADTFAALNSLVDSWAAERLMIYTTARNVYNILAGQQIYMLGPDGPDWIGPRPQYLDAAGLILVNNDPTQAYERPLHVVRSDREWARVRMKALQSTLPTALYFDSYFSNSNSTTNPVGSANVALWPCPTIVNQVALYTPQAVSQFAALTQAIALPPAYARALAYNLAVEIAPEFEREPSNTVLGIAMEAKESIKRSNAPLALGKLRVDLGLETRRGAFDPILGEER